MTRNPPPEQVQAYAEFEVALRNLELARITGRPVEQADAGVASQLWGLALSGGGIRSATFCLGVLQGLAKRGLLGAFHYCSTVSGGGYIGGYLQAMLKRKGLDETIGELAGKRHAPSTGNVPSSSPTPPPCSGFTDSVLDLRRFSNFLTPNKRAFSGDRISMGATYLANMVLTQIQLGALIFLVSFAPLLAVRGLAELSRGPLVIWLSAIVLAVVALAARPRMSTSPGLPASASHPAQPALFRTVPPMFMGLVFVLLATLVWLSPACPPGQGCRHGFELVGLLIIGAFGPGVPWHQNSLAGAAAATTYLIGFYAWLIWWWPVAKKNYLSTFGRRAVRQLILGPIAAVVIGVATAAIAELTQGLGKQPYLAIALGAPLLFALFFLVNLLHMSLAYMRGDAVSRERWTRLMGRTALWIFGVVTLPIVLTIVLPDQIRFYLKGVEEAGRQELALGGGVVGALWLLISGTGARAAYREVAQAMPKGVKERLVKILIGISLWVFLAGIVLIAGLGVMWVAKVENLDSWAWIGGVNQALTWMSAAAITWLVLAYFIDENEFSMNSFYRNRLVRCYLAPSRGTASRDADTGLDPEGDDIALNQLGLLDKPDPSGRPLYPLICGAINLLKSERLEWQDRKSASFVFSPLFCGHQPLPGGLTGPLGDSLNLPAVLKRGTGLGYSELAAEHTLGAAISVSGAAVSPNMGYHSSPAVTALLTLFNARLGWWVRNHNAPRSSIYFPGLNLISELMSNTRDTSRYVYVSDGGHFENTGIYELVRRRCRFILSVDATADPERKFGDLANAVHKCRVDFGAEIDIDTSLLDLEAESVSRRCAALGKITYDDGKQGVLLYIKPSIMGTESADVAHYARSHAAFPHEPTHDQFFDETQFECYRQLGYESTMNVFNDRARGLGSLDDKVLLNDLPRKEEIVQSLTYRLYEPANAIADHHTRHRDELTLLLERQRSNAKLACLDRQLYPGLHSAVSSTASPLRMELPPPACFRDCFYFVQQLIQLMEGVYVDLDLERNSNHPDNRGWMNQFRHWVWVPMFRLVWSLSLQTRGSRFVRFCETHLDMPRIDGENLDIEWVTLRSIQDLRRTTMGFYKAGKINFVEFSLLRSRAMLEQCKEARQVEIGRMKFVREGFIRPLLTAPTTIEPMGVGVAVVVEDKTGAQTLTTLRVQDHLRRLGIGIVFMRQVIGKFPKLQGVEVKSGDYGRRIGELDEQKCSAQAENLRRLLDQARAAL